MENTHITEQLAAYADGELAAAERDFATSHLAECQECIGALDDVRIGLKAMSMLPVATAPDFLWTAIERQIAPKRRPHGWHLLAAAAILVIVGAAAVWQLKTQASPAWEVTGLTPGVTRPVSPGEWIETRETGEVSVRVGSIGMVRLAPHTRLRMEVSSRTEQRLALASGHIHVRIAAPPRLFMVDTAAGTAVDLGCEYELACDRDGNGFLRVTQGWVSYEWQGRESLAPAGSSCLTRYGRPPGTPVFDDAPAAFSAAAEQLDQGSEAGLEVMLATARARDTLTLWHMLARVSTDASRVRVFDRMVAFAALPQGISRDAVLALDRDALRRWREELAWTW